MSRLQVNEITNAAGTGAPGFPYGIPASTDIPFRLHATIGTPDALLHIELSEIEDFVGVGRVAYPIGGAIPSFPHTTINFQTNVVLGGGTVNITFPSGTAGFYRRVGFALTTTGEINAYFTAEDVNLAGVASPATLFTNDNELPIGWVDIQNTNGATAYKTADSATNIVENKVGTTSVIHQFVNGKASPPAVGGSIGGTISGGTPGSILFVDGSNNLAQNTTLHWDYTNNRMGVGIAAPTSKLHVVSNAAGDNAVTVTYGGNTNSLLVTATSAATNGILFRSTNVTNVNPTLQLDHLGDGTGLLVQATNGIGASITNASPTNAALSLVNADTSGPILILQGAAGGEITFYAPNTITSYPLTFPDAQGAINTYLKNDGSGGLTWATIAAQSLQSAYNAGATITTTGNDIVFSGPDSFEVTMDGGMLVHSTTDLQATPLSIAVGDANNPNVALQATTAGLGGGVLVNSTNLLTTVPALQVTTNATAGAAISATNSSSTVATLRLRNTDNMPGPFLSILGATSGQINLYVSATTGSYPLYLPAAQGALNTFLRNDGAGNLSWAASASTLQSAYDGGNIIDTTVAALDVIIQGTEKLLVTSDNGVEIAPVTISAAPALNVIYDGSGSAVRVTTSSGTGINVTHEGTGAALIALKPNGSSGDAVFGNHKADVGSAGAFQSESLLNTNAALIVRHFNSSAPSISVMGATSGQVNILSPAAVTTYSITLPSAVGATNTFLRNSGAGGILSWAPALTVGDTVASATTGSIFFAGTSGVLAQDNANLFWDDPNNRLGVGTSSPTTTLEVKGVVTRSDAGGGVKQEYIHSTTLTASTTAVAANFTFAHATYQAVVIAYTIKEATTNAVRAGTIKVATNGVTVSLIDDFAETADVGVTWSAAINGANVELSYTTTANNKTMRSDIKRFLV